MHTVITHIALASAAALVFLLANSALQSKICAVGRYFIGWLLVIGFILPIKIPLFRVEIPESALTALGYEAETDVPLSPPYVFDIPADEDQAVPAEREQMPQASAPNGNEHAFPAEAVIFALYIIGFFLALSCTLFRYCRAAKVLQRCGRAPKEEEASEYSKLCKKLCVKKAPRLLVCPYYAVGSSLTFGFCQKTIVISDKITKEDAAYILGHELTHCKRKDNFAKAFLALLFSLYWFNPIMHVFIRAMGNLLEQACDEEFLSGGDLEERKRYCRLLVTTASVNKSFIFNTFKGGKVQMKKRLDNILTQKSKKLTAFAIATVLALTLISSVVYAAVVPASNNATEEANVLSEQDIKDQFLGWEELSLYGYNDEEKEELADRYFNTSTPYGLSQGQIHELSDQTWKYNGKTILLIQHNGENWKVQSDARPALAANGIGVDIVDMPDGTVEIRVLSDEELVKELFSTAFVFETIYMEDAYNEYLESDEYKYLLETRPYSEHYGTYEGPFLNLERFTNENGSYDYQKFYETRHLYNENWYEGKLDLESDYWQNTQLFWKTLFARIGVTVE
ncbi:MAG: M56 family metallopeptidase [Ruminococcaceae bacterium]|nr:M56 family metallopeptidase [Oscillospiraceae bacterium]